MAAMYQALENTVLTPSALTRHGYDDMKRVLAEEMGLVNYAGLNDDVLLEYYYQVVCLNTNVSTLSTRKRRSVSDQLSDEEILMRSYGSSLGYRCGLGRMFESYEGDLYDEVWIHCNWNKTWMPVTELDTCTWVQCIDPPQVIIQGVPKNTPKI